MPIELDLLDRKILHELDINSRQPVTILAKKLRRSRNVIEYRIARLQERGIIKRFVTLLDPGKLGFMIWNVYLQLQNMDSQKEKEFIAYLKDNKRIWWVGLTSGSWDLIYSVYARDIKELSEIIKEIDHQYNHYILRQSLIAHVQVEVFSRGYLLNKPGNGICWYEKIDHIKLDKLDQKILKILATDARISIIELAHRTKSTPRIVAYRIKDLLKQRIITRFRLEIDVSKFGYGFYKVLIHNFDLEQNNRLKEYCRKLGNVFHYENKIGPWMLELEMDIESYEKANDLMRKIKEEFAIRSYEVLHIHQEPKGELDLTQQL